MIFVMTLESPVSRLLIFAVILLIPLTSRAELVNKTVDDAYIHNSYQPNGTQSSGYLDGIQYYPAWSHDNGDSKWFNDTYSSLKKARSNLIYFFQGDTIHYYGETGGSDHAPVMVYLDGDPKGEMVLTNTSTSTINYEQLLWSKTGLGSGDHQIIVTHGGQTGQVVGLDYFVIESDHEFVPSRAGPAASSIPPGAIIVDDNNLEFITYTNWLTEVFESGGVKFYYNNTIHRTKVPGSYATFKFTGTAVWYLTDTYLTHADLNITLDGVFNDVVKTRSGTTLSQRIVWNATDLEYGEHTVIVTHKDDASSYATLDYFMYLPGESPQKPKSATGPIIGGVIGGAVLVALCMAGYMLVRRRRAAKLQSIDLNGPDYGFNQPPLLNPSTGSQPVALQPIWGYVATPYVAQATGSSPAVNSEAYIYAE
ncbi:transmembrane protein, putative, partial [Rhizoctonia solani AG-3 Rhs1AP]